MTIEQTETVDVVETETPEVIDTPVDTPELSEDDSMEAAWDRLTTPERDENGRFKAKGDEPPEGDPEAAPEANEEVAAEGEEAPETAETEEIEVPTYLPVELTEHWKNIPEAAREAIAKSQQAMGGKLANMSRRAMAFEPIAQSVEQAVKQFPELANMTPAQIAQDTFELANTRANLMRDPVNTLMQVATQMGALDQLAAKLGGRGQEAGQPANLQMEMIKLQQQNAQLQNDLRQASNPDNIRSVVEQQFATHSVQNEVNQYAAGKEHWGAVESDIPALIPAAQHLKGAEASQMEILDAAYQMAINARGLKASAAADPAKAPATLDPRRTEAAIRAKSVNVSSQPGKQKPLTEEQAMNATWARLGLS